MLRIQNENRGKVDSQTILMYVMYKGEHQTNVSVPAYLFSVGQQWLDNIFMLLPYMTQLTDMCHSAHLKAPLHWKVLGNIQCLDDFKTHLLYFEWNSYDQLIFRAHPIYIKLCLQLGQHMWEILSIKHLGASEEAAYNVINFSRFFVNYSGNNAWILII